MENGLGQKALEGKQIKAECVRGKTDKGGRRYRETKLKPKASEGE